MSAQGRPVERGHCPRPQGRLSAAQLDHRSGQRRRHWRRPGLRAKISGENRARANLYRHGRGGSGVRIAMQPMSQTIKTTCPYCGTGCGVSADVDGEAVRVSGDKDHPANFGRLCIKGANLAQTLTSEERLLYPQIGGARASWDDALDLVAAMFRQTIETHGPDSVAFYVSGQLLTE